MKKINKSKIIRYLATFIGMFIGTQFPHYIGVDSPIFLFFSVFIFGSFAAIYVMVIELMMDKEKKR